TCGCAAVRAPRTEARRRHGRRCPSWRYPRSVQPVLQCFDCLEQAPEVAKRDRQQNAVRVDERIGGGDDVLRCQAAIDLGGAGNAGALWLRSAHRPSPCIITTPLLSSTRQYLAPSDREGS